VTRRLLLPVLAVTALTLQGARAAPVPVSTKLLTGFKTCTLTGFSTGLAIADTFVRQDLPTSTNGTSQEVDVRSSSGANRRTFVRFGLPTCSPAIPSTARVLSAQLRLYLFGAPAATRSYEVRRVVAPCPEGLSACWGETTMTWNNQPAVATSPTGSASGCTTCANAYASWDVTTDVQAFLAGTAANDGFRVADSAEGSTTAMAARFYSRERNTGARVNQAPQLVVTYVP